MRAGRLACGSSSVIILDPPPVAAFPLEIPSDVYLKLLPFLSGTTALKGVKR